MWIANIALESHKAFVNNGRFSLAGVISLYLSSMFSLAWQECVFPTGRITMGFGVYSEKEEMVIRKGTYVLVKRKKIW